MTGGIIRGAGKPRIGAIFNFVGYYLIGIPIVLSLMFAAKMGIVGEDRRAIDTVTLKTSLKQAFE